LDWELLEDDDDDDREEESPLDISDIDDFCFLSASETDASRNFS